MSGFGSYRVNAGVNFESNGVAVMRDLAKAVTTASDVVDANTKALMANARAVKALGTAMRDTVQALGGGTAALNSNASAADRVTAAYDRATAAAQRFNAAALGASAFGAGAGSARVISGGGMPPISRMAAGALGAAAFGTSYYSPAWAPGPRALPPWRNGAVPALAGGSGLAGGPPPPPPGWGNWNFGSQYWPVPSPGRQTRNIGGGGWMGGGGGGGGRGGGGGFNPLYWAGGFAGAGAAGFRVANAISGGPIGHMVEGAGIVDSVVEAARFQAQLQSISNIVGITGGGRRDVQARARLRQEMFDVGDQFAMSPIQSANMFREIARQSQGAMPLSSMEQMLPQIARMQVVLSQTRHMAPQETTDAAMNFVHLLRLYTPEQMIGKNGKGGGFDLMTRLMEMAPVNPQQLVRQMTYVAPDFLNLGIPNEQLAALMLTLTRSGYGTGKGATGIAQLVKQSLGPAQITSFSSAIKQNYLQKMGLLDKKGEPSWVGAEGGDVFKLLAGLGTYEQNLIKKRGMGMGRAIATRDFTAVFGVQGSRMADLLTDPRIVGILQGSIRTMRDQKSLGLDEQSNAFLNLTTTRIQRAFQNFQALMTEIGWVTLPAVSKAFNDLGDTLHNAQHWLNAHKAETKEWSDALVGFVKSVEVELVAHQKDFIAIGQSFLIIGQNASSLVPPLIKFTGEMTKLVRVFSDIFSGNVKDLLKMATEKSTFSNLSEAEINEYLRGKRKVGEGTVHGSGPLPMNQLQPGGAKPRGTWVGLPGAPGSHFIPDHAQLPRSGAAKAAAGGNPITVSIVIQGAGKNAKEIADLIDARFKALARNPRLFQATGGVSRTGPGIPNSLAVTSG